LRLSPLENSRILVSSSDQLRANKLAIILAHFVRCQQSLGNKKQPRQVLEQPPDALAGFDFIRIFAGLTPCFVHPQRVFLLLQRQIPARSVSINGLRNCSIQINGDQNQDFGITKMIEPSFCCGGGRSIPEVLSYVSSVSICGSVDSGWLTFFSWSNAKGFLCCTIELLQSRPDTAFICR